MATIDIFNMTDTWTGGTAYTAIKMNVTDTSSTAGSLLADLQVGGASKFNVRKDGFTTVANGLNSPNNTVTATDFQINNGTNGYNFGSPKDAGISRLGAASLAIGSGTAGDNSGSLQLARILPGAGSAASPSIAFSTHGQVGFYDNSGNLGVSVGGALQAQFVINKLQLATTTQLEFSYGSGPILVYDAANTLALRNSTSAQTFNVYNTYTDASNNEKLTQTFLTNVAVIGTNKLGTGTARAMFLASGNYLYFGGGWAGSAASGAQWQIDTSGHFSAVSSNSYDIGVAGSLPRYVRAGSALVSPSTVVASLPSAATAGAGARSFVTDATATTFLSTVAGGGANKVPVVSDGTNWLIGG